MALVSTLADAARVSEQMQFQGLDQKQELQGQLLSALARRMLGKLRGTGEKRQSAPPVVAAFFGLVRNMFRSPICTWKESILTTKHQILPTTTYASSHLLAPSVSL